VTGKTVVYDGDCPLCVSASQSMVRRGWIDEAHRRAFQSYAGDDAARLLEAGVRDGVGVIDDDTGRIRTGLDALLHLFEDRPPPLWARAARTRALRPLFALGYGLVAANRRALAPPPPRDVACACDPTPRPALQGTFALLCALVFVAIAACEALTLARLEPAGARTVAIFVLLLEAAPWFAQAAVVAARPAGQRLAAYGSFAWSATVSSLWLVPVLAVLRHVDATTQTVALGLGLALRLVTLRVMESKRRRDGRWWTRAASWTVEVGVVSAAIAGRELFVSLVA
jgi:predicted DCC family thiol-disulfide oxidoreductase YuxK